MALGKAESMNVGAEVKPSLGKRVGFALVMTLCEFAGYAAIISIFVPMIASKARKGWDAGGPR